MSSNQIVTTMPSEGIDGIKITEEQAKYPSKHIIRPIFGLML